MKVGGHRMREHARLLAPLFGLIFAIWLLRLVVGSMDASPRILTVLSVTGATSLSMLLAAALIHFRQFGSYPNVVVSSFLLALFAQALIIGAVVVAVITGTENIFTAPQFSVPNDPHHIKHIVGQLTFGIGSGTLLGSATGCLILFLLRILVPVRCKPAEME
jgi:hypothetical protein